MSRETALAVKLFGASSALAFGVLFAFGSQAWPCIAVVLSCATLAVVVGLTQRTRAEVESRYRRVESLLAIYSVITPRKPLPAPRPYMGSPELLRAVTASIFELSPQCTVELGSGVTTLVAAYALAKLGSGRMLSFDHEAHYAEQTNQLLRAHGLDHIAQVFHAPLVEVQVGNHRGRWYDRAVLERAGVGAVDLLIVDGPPGNEQPLARYPALPLLERMMSERSWVLVDDAARKDETEMARRWAAEFPRFELDVMQTEKGTTFLRRPAGPALAGKSA
ncbi:MAG TPA: class I SAM-dependent methyltransferase [Polyangiales bacterium]